MPAGASQASPGSPSAVSSTSPEETDCQDGKSEKDLAADKAQCLVLTDKAYFVAA